MKERLLQAYFCDGLDIGVTEVLAEVAAELGFDREQVTTLLETSAGVGEVADDIERATELGPRRCRPT